VGLTASKIFPFTLETLSKTRSRSLGRRILVEGEGFGDCFVGSDRQCRTGKGVDDGVVRFSGGKSSRRGRGRSAKGCRLEREGKKSKFYFGRIQDDSSDTNMMGNQAGFSP